MANGHGGKRAGSGRPRKAELYKDQIRIAQDTIAGNLQVILGKAMELVNGVTCVRVVRGQDVIYDEPPCAKTIVFLVEQILGKSTQAVELTGEEGGPIELTTRELTTAEIELREWRAKMRATVTVNPSSGPSATPTPPISSTISG